MLWGFFFSCFTPTEATREATREASSSPPKPNVVVVVIDTLRTDHVTEEIAPNLLVMARRGRRYTNTWSTSSWTAPASASIATGLLPIEHGIYRGLVASAEQTQGTLRLNTLPSEIPTLAEKFKAGGYHTYGLASNINIDAAIGFNRGFDEFLCAPEEDAHVLFEKINQWQPKEPYFLYLHLNDVHSPYAPRAPWYHKQTDTHQDMMAAYDSEISYLDNELAKLYQKMHWENNVVLITADHGEEFLDHGQYGHLESLHRELTHVIFWLAGPGIPAQESPTFLSLADTHHILLHALGMAPKAAPTPILGQRVGAKEEIWSLRTMDWTWISGKLYHASDVQEENNVATEHPDVMSEMEARLQKILTEKGRRESQYTTHSMNEEGFDLLKQLGYVE